MRTIVRHHPLGTFSGLAVGLLGVTASALAGRDLGGARLDVMPGVADLGWLFEHARRHAAPAQRLPTAAHHGGPA